MPFNEDQLSWLEIAQAKSADFEQFGEQMRVKNEELAKISKEISRLHKELKEASEDLEITWEEDQKKHFWNKSKRQMDWKTGDRDVEVDTVHDLKDGYQVDPQKAKRVQKLHEELVKIQTRMEEAKTESGKNVFTAKDIERELWSPLIMANIIPSNAVGDKYSQEAQVFNGACEIYKEKLEEHSKTASKYENIQRGLRIAGDVVTMCGTIAGESVKAANFDAMAISQHDKVTKAEYNKIPVSERSLEQQRFLDDMKLKENAAAEVARNLAAAQVATTFVTSGLDITSSSLEKKNDKKGWLIAEKVFIALGETATGSLLLANKQVATSNPTLAGTEQFKTAMASATSLVNYGFKAGKVVFRIQEICTAVDEGGRKAAAAGLIKAVAGSIGDAFAAFDVQSGKGSDGTTDVVGTGGQWAKIGGIVSLAITGTANTGFIAEHIYKAMKSEGGLKNPSALVSAIGLNVIAPIMVGVFDQMADASRQDITGTGTKGSTRNFEETTSEKSANMLTGAKLNSINDTIAKTMDTLNSSVQGKQNEGELKSAIDAKKLEEEVMKAMKGLDLKNLSDTLLKSVPSGASLEEKQRAVAERMAKMELEERKKAVGEFQKQLRDDPKVKEEFFKQIQAQSDEESKALEKLIGEAPGSPEDLEDEAKAKKAAAAMDKLILEAQALNQRWATIDALTSGGTAILVAALPVAGLAAAIQRMAMDVAILVRKSYQLNKWFKNMALTAGNNSVYGPSIAGRLASAQVQVSQQAVRVVFDAIGVAAESAKLADCMGVATGVSIANTMAKALVEFGYKMQKEAAIDKGWQLYKKALENPGDRKVARKAMKWNSTLSKCVLAYGIVKDGDPIAKEVARSCGMTPEVLADQNEVCGKVVTYFQTLYSDDPIVVRRIPLKKAWHPGSPILTLESWLRFKASAIDYAKPSLSQDSARTPEIDRHLAVLTGLIGEDGNYAKKRDDVYPEVIDIRDESGIDPRLKPEYRKFLVQTSEAAEGLVKALRGWRPQNGRPDEDEETTWTEGARHEGMDDIAVSLVAQAQLLAGEVSYDLKLLDEKVKTMNDTIKGLVSVGGSDLVDSGEAGGTTQDDDVDPSVKKEKLETVGS
jgi:hypothetical protein